MVRVAIVVILALASAVAAQEPPAIPDRTTVTAHLQTGHQKGQNLVWCNSFHLAWTALGQDVCGEPLQLQGSPILERVLNGSTVSGKDLDEESAFVKAGLITPAFLEELNASLKKRFGDQAPPPVTASADPPGALAFACLRKTLAFQKPFDRQKEPLLWKGAEGEKTPLQAFGIVKVDGQTPKELTSQIQILVDGRDGYVVELKTTSKDDRLILAQTGPKTTLKETLDDVRERVRAAKPFAIQVTDQCLIPVVQIALERVYDEIVGRAVLNPKLKDHRLTDARQSIRFALDEKGASLKSEAKILALKNGHSPRRIVFDRPFLLYLERAGAENPYLAVWFENPNLFVKPESGEKKQ